MADSDPGSRVAWQRTYLLKQTRLFAPLITIRQKILNPPSLLHFASHFQDLGWMGGDRNEHHTFELFAQATNGNPWYQVQKKHPASKTENILHVFCLGLEFRCFCLNHLQESHPCGVD